MPPSKLNIHAFAVIMLCFFAFTASALISRLTFDRLPHLEDEYAYTFEARTLARGDMAIEAPLTRRAYWQPFVVDHDGMRFGKYPPGWALLLAGGTLAGQEWVVNALLAALTVPLVYAIGRDLFGRDTGLIGAALAAFSPMALLLDATLMAHTSALWLGTLALWAYLRLERRMDAKAQRRKEKYGKGRLIWAVVCGVSLGLLTANRPITGVAFALPLVARALALGIQIGQTGLGGRSPNFVGQLLPYDTPVADGQALETGKIVGQDVGGRSIGRPYDPPVSVVVAIRAWFTSHLIIAVFALLVFAIMPLYNIAATGSPTTDLYTFVWSYDRVGYGDCCGRHGHTLAKGFIQSRYDLSLTAADLFGWQLGTLSDASRAHLLTDSDYYPQIGVSWVLLPFGVLIGLRRRWWVALAWTVVIVAAYMFALQFDGGSLSTNPSFGWAWVIVALGWTLLPIMLLRDRRMSWTWILFATAALLIGLQLTYWIGSQRYSTRYYFEGLTGVAILSALPIASLLKYIDAKARRRKGIRGDTEDANVGTQYIASAINTTTNPLRFARPLVYGVVGVVLLWSLVAYSLPRIDVLKGYNMITRSLLDQVAARREPGKDVLVIITGADVRWRAYGALMASTSPYLDSPIVAAWDYSNGTDPTVRQEILDRFPDRQVIDMIGNVNDAQFVESP